MGFGLKARHLRHFLPLRGVATKLGPSGAGNLVVASAATGAIGGLLFSSLADEVIHLPSGGPLPAGTSYGVFVGGGASAAVVASTHPQKIYNFNSIASARNSGLTTICRTATFSCGVGIRTAFSLFLWLGANTTAAVWAAMMSLNPSDGILALAFPFVTFSLLTLLLVPAFWAAVCFGGVGLVTGLGLGASLLTQGIDVVAMSRRQALLRQAVVRCCLVSPVVLGTSVAMGLVPNVLKLVSEQMDGQFGDFGEFQGEDRQIDWKTRRSRFREM